MAESQSNQTDGARQQELFQGEPGATKHCTKCQQIKPLSEFAFTTPKKGRAKPHHSNKCKPCMAEYGRQYRKTLKESGLDLLGRPEAELSKIRVYQQRRQLDLCVSCGGPRRPGYVKCQPCRAMQALFTDKAKKDHERHRSFIDRGLCRRCGKNPHKGGRVLCGDCLEKSRQENANRSGRAICMRCSVPTAPGVKRCDKCRAIAIEDGKRRAKALKDEVFAAYGGYRCACCGETLEAGLTIDHINGDGAEHRREMNTKGGNVFYIWLKKNGFPPHFQPLCFTCNFAKRLGQVCPHETARRFMLTSIAKLAMTY